MKNTCTNLAMLFFAFLLAPPVFSQQHSSCPNVLNETIQLYQPSQSAVACEYDTYGKCINSFAKIPLLSEELYFFDTRFRDNGVELIWQSKEAHPNETFTVLRSRDGEQFRKIAEVHASDFGDGKISFLDNLPMLGNNYYILKKVKENQTLISNQLVVYVSLGICHLETMNIRKTKDEISMKYFVDNSGQFQLLVTDTEGNERMRKGIFMEMGKNDVQFNLPISGIYFVTLTNGFSSVTDLILQSNGSTDNNSAVAETEKTK